jgi:hypothetical protein
MPFPGGERTPERPRPRNGSANARLATRTLAKGAPAGTSATVDVARVEAMLRRYHGEPARIENPFAAFPTRSFWLGRLMHDDR